MTGREFAALRRRLGMTNVEFGRALGYGGGPKNINRMIRRYQSFGQEPIPPGPAQRAAALERPLDGRRQRF